MKRNILITGIYGFIGANFAIYWNNHYPDDRIIGIDKMTYACEHDLLSRGYCRRSFCTVGF